MITLDVTLRQLATRYAAAWSSQDPELLASFYDENGSLSVNGGPPAVGRAAVIAKAGEFMTAFPDMLVRVERVEPRPRGADFHWIWTGTNTGPGGTGRAVRLTGCEEWTLSASGRILESKGHFDEAEYRRQLGSDV